MSGLVPMTVEGADNLQKELDHLRKVERPRITKAIAEARAHGDLKENAEYHTARDQQGMAEARIRDIESKLSHAQVIDIQNISPGERVIFGATVDLINAVTGEAQTYKIVGEDEADVKQSRISVNSPLARAIIGKEIGDVVSVHAPGGEVEWEIETSARLNSQRCKTKCSSFNWPDSGANSTCADPPWHWPGTQGRFCRFAGSAGYRVARRSSVPSAGAFLGPR